jgi:transporter family-2 protein
MTKYIVIAAFGGALLPLQALVNARTSAVLGGPLWATMVNFIGGFLMLTPVMLMLRSQVPTLEQAGRVPLYAWLTGFVGVVFVAQAAYTTPKLGAAGMTAVVIAAQMFASITLDHFGILQTQDTLTPQKMFGALLLIAGVWLILRPGGT